MYRLAARRLARFRAAGQQEPSRSTVNSFLGRVVRTSLRGPAGPAFLQPP